MENDVKWALNPLSVMKQCPPFQAAMLVEHQFALGVSFAIISLKF